MLFSGSRLFQGASLLLLIATCASANASRPYPADPFAMERRVLPATEIGTARGQTRVAIMGALVHGKSSQEDIYFGAKTSMEFVLHEFGAIRLTGFQDMLETDFKSLNHKFTSARVGPALHLRPYRRIDLGPYLEAGALIVDAVDGKTKSGPEVALGGFISIHLDSYWFLQLELERSFARVEVDGLLGSQHRTAAMLGLGFAF